jgi:hypothetical protein
VRLRDVVRVQPGQRTEVFRRLPAPELDALSLSLIYRDGAGRGRERSLDLICGSAAEFDAWLCGLRLYAEWAAGLVLPGSRAAGATPAREAAHRGDYRGHWAVSGSIGVLNSVSWPRPGGLPCVVRTPKGRAHELLFDGGSSRPR